MKNVGADGLDGCLDVGQSLPFPVGHSATRSRSARARTAGFRSLAGTRSTLVPRMASSSACTRPSPSKPMSGGTVNEQVNVTIGPVLAASYAAEDPQVGHVMGRGRRNQVPPPSPDLPPHRTGQPAQLRRLMLDIHHEIASGRIDQLGQGRQRRLTPPGLIRADHTLRDTRPEGQFRLRQPRARDRNGRRPVTAGQVLRSGAATPPVEYWSEDDWLSGPGSRPWTGRPAARSGRRR